MGLPASLARDISPPRPSKRRRTSATDIGSSKAKDTLQSDANPTVPKTLPALAAVEAGKVKIDDHLTYFKSHLVKSSRNTRIGVPRLSIDAFAALYHSNAHSGGHHFVVHQHNHPIAGVHYDLRLQFSETSSMSFALPKGLPGNPNSKSIGRMAIETRVHNYWNHLIESASRKTGSLIIWDTGTYYILPRTKRKNGMPSPQTKDNDETEDDEVANEGSEVAGGECQESSKLVAAFKARYIRLRLHGTRLLNNYTVVLRLPSNEIVKKPTARRNGRRRRSQRSPATRTPATSDDEASIAHPSVNEEAADQDLDTDTEEDDLTRATNAYPGSTNDIGSVHQRRWFLQLDRQNSGFRLDSSGEGRGKWTGGFNPFFVRGRDHERSVVTGRLARDVESDEGVEGFVGRGGWIGIEH
ncbi:DNA polymerase ligase-domain-containing protein [Alternaria rosae]|uniref:DNA polymerase ligase-domain-containing protein n=1 Tax=Alternaria rosae TaxID=1187941 RepID=UPI001E8DF0ED|nr:DNA polymerase ligase-domain-containing protein [Alternaria rosae]KAH6878046.1 DNA polymerase ligase-domain-containing protein [Alternaria rosae]